VFAAARLSPGNPLAAHRHFVASASLEIAETPARQGLTPHGMDSALSAASSRDANPMIRTGRTPGRSGHRPEDIMFIYLFLLLRKTLDRAEHCRRDTYLASAVDMVELERRMRAMEFDH
jgi:hypothetical protein